MPYEVNPDGVPALISIEDIGPLFGRVFHQEAEPLYLDPEGSFEFAVPGPRSWRVEVPEIPHRLIGPLREHVEHLGRPAEVRLWGTIAPECYVGKAYALFNSLAPHSAVRPPSIGITLHGQGRLDRERPEL
jgi:hypothetical protein